MAASQPDRFVALGSVCYCSAHGSYSPRSWAFLVTDDAQKPSNQTIKPNPKGLTNHFRSFRPAVWPFMSLASPAALFGSRLAHCEATSKIGGRKWSGARNVIDTQQQAAISKSGEASHHFHYIFKFACSLGQSDLFSINRIQRNEIEAGNIPPLR